MCVIKHVVPCTNEVIIAIGIYFLLFLPSFLSFVAVQDLSGVNAATQPSPPPLDPSTDILPEGTLGETSTVIPSCQDVDLNCSVSCPFRFL